MNYDTEAIRERITMVQLLEADGVRVVRKGGRWFASCPFHEERTASLAVTERTGLWFCFGCGAGGKGHEVKGDIFGYWMATRGVDFPTAAAALARMAGTGEMPQGTKLPPRKIVDNHKPYVAPELSGRDLERWKEGVEFLQENEEWQQKLSTWRGFARDTIEVMMKHGAIALPVYFGARRWAFPVVAVENEEGQTRFVGYHVRFDPDPKEKAQWHYVPKSTDTRPTIGAWPLVLGDPKLATCVVFLEGEWDALAFADAMGWGVMTDESRVAIFGVRGGRNLATLAAWQWRPGAQAFLWADNDLTGDSWRVVGGLGAMVRARSRAIHGFSFQGVKDFNDALKVGKADPNYRIEYREFLKRKMEAGVRRRQRRAPKLSE